MSEAQKKLPVATFGDAPVSAVHRRIPPAVAEQPERIVRPRLWVSIASVLLVVSLSVGSVALAAGYYAVAVACVTPAATCALLLGLADSWGLSS